ncbi:hypothetical protein J6590_065329 [Homalodisca vitripennis]|nr:hypothetical protein J6590_065329 [Homalodisca vitripennis]
MKGSAYEGQGTRRVRLPSHYCRCRGRSTRRLPDPRTCALPPFYSSHSLPTVQSFSVKPDRACRFIVFISLPFRFLSGVLFPFPCKKCGRPCPTAALPEIHGSLNKISSQSRGNDKPLTFPADL